MLGFLLPAMVSPNLGHYLGYTDIAELRQLALRVSGAWMGG